MFDSKKFLSEEFTSRTSDKSVPALKKWFPKDCKPVWTVRGLTGKEIGSAKKAAAKNKSIAGILEMLKSVNITEQTDAMKAVLDLGKDRITDNVAERLEQLVTGSVSPECDLDLALKICERFPVEFYELTNEILKLTGLGMMPGKQKGSGKQQTLVQA